VQAEADNVPIAVRASIICLGMYEKAGFRRTKRFDVDHLFDTGKEGVWTLIWEPLGGSEGMCGRRSLRIRKRRQCE
jgi:hypothetical protein